ncbi:hypothetical protein C0992_003383 [Termitomyces sp. T32_za158]|nr:hypothetical protein C0992_003383 [Termitomyces sp. T32_za158]
MSASARAEARRKAILSRGSDRLAKLTTSARGDDPAYIHPGPCLILHFRPIAHSPADPPVSTVRKTSSNFLGEEPAMPTPPNRLSPGPEPASPPNLFTAPPDPSVWSEQQQQQFLQALMAGTRPPEAVPEMAPIDAQRPPLDNPLAAMLFPQGQSAFPQFSPAGMEGKTPAAAVPALPTRLQKLMPFVHLLSMWALLAYFVFYMEPRLWTESFVDAGGQKFEIWRRWAELGRTTKLEDVALMLRIQVLPFFWAFMTLQIALHSVRIFSGFDAVQPPTLLAFVLPHLPPPLPSIIVNGLKYLQMGSLFLDDLAGLLVGIGFIIMFSGWFTTS